MFEPLDTARLAYRHGRRRGWVVISSAMAPTVIGSAITLLEYFTTWISDASAQPAPEMMWLSFGMFVAAGCILLQGAWLVVMDAVRGDYRELAERYKREHWFPKDHHNWDRRL